MQEGDKISIEGVEFTIWLIEDGIYHIVDSEGNGFCGPEEWLINIKD